MNTEESALSSLFESEQAREEGLRVNFLGYPLHTHSFEQTLVAVDKIVRARKPTQHCVLNSYKLRLLAHDPELRTIVGQCSLVQADGMSVVWAARLLGLPKVPRVTGIDLMEALIEIAASKGYRLFFLGAENSIVKATVDHYQKRFPSLQVVGWHHGYFEDEKSVVDKIYESRADILFVGMGSPSKERFIAKNLQRMDVPFCMGVGGSFDVISGRIPRAPRWVQNAGCEWLYRTIQEPSRLLKRYTLSHINLALTLAKTLMSRTGRG